MPNTVYGPFVATNVVNGSTPANATWGNNVQTQASAALHGFNGDLLTPFVLSGVTSARNGTTLNQLDVTSGSAYVKFADNTIGLVSVVASTAGQFTTSTPSTTYYLFLLNTGLWQWGTTSTGPANSLAICQATTDGSGNILVVTDRRTLSTTLLSAASASVNTPGLSASGNVVLNGNFFLQKAWSGTGSAWAWLLQALPNSLPVNKTWEMSYNGGSGEIQFYNDSDSQMPLSLGPGTTGNTAIGNAGNLAKIAGQATAGSYGTPVIVAVANNTHVTSTTPVNILNVTAPATGLYRLSPSISLTNAGPQTVTLALTFTDGNTSATSGLYFDYPAATMIILNAASLAGPRGIPILPQSFYAKTGTAIQLQYVDATGTPNDWVSATLERLT